MLQTICSVKKAIKNRLILQFYAVSRVVVVFCSGDKTTKIQYICALRGAYIDQIAARARYI